MPSYKSGTKLTALISLVYELKSFILMLMHPISRGQLLQVQLALLIAIALQLNLNDQLTIGQRTAIILIELSLVFVIGFTAPRRHRSFGSVNRTAAIVLIGLLTVANIISLFLVCNALIHGTSNISGLDLLSSSLAIYATNIIVFGLWYWEIDSPGLTGIREHKMHADFEFPQMRNNKRYSEWEPTFLDYMYLSITNALNFAPADTVPITHGAKLLMGTQAVISLLTLALVATKAVSILA